MNSKSYRGQWFLVESVTKVDSIFKREIPKLSRAFEGQLEFDLHVGSTLTIYGGTGLPRRFSNKNYVFIGNTNHGPVTAYLCNCYSQSTGREVVHKYNVQYVLEGGHIYEPGTALFYSAYVELHNLSEWIGKSSISITGISDPTYTVKTKVLKDIDFAIDEDTKGKFSFYNNGLVFGVFQKDVSLRHYSQLVIERTNTGLDLAGMLKMINIFQTFLMVCSNKPTYLISLSLFTNNDVRRYGARGLTRVEFNLLSPIYESLKNAQSTEQYNMLVGYQDLSKDKLKVISTWYRSYHLSPSSFDLLGLSYYSHHTLIENRFLNLAQAIESYHSKRSDKVKMDRKSFKAIQTRILQTFNHTEFPVENEILKRTLNMANGLSLSDRLSDLISRVDCPEFTPIIQDKADFLTSVRDSRNYYTHYDKPKKAKFGIDLLHLSGRLKALLIATILMDLGFSKEFVAKKVARIYRFYN